MTLYLPQSNISNGAYAPSDYGLIAWNYPIDALSSSTLLATAGTVNLMRLKLNAGASVTSVCVVVANAGGTLTSGQCFAGLYQGGTLIGTTADQATAWQSTGAKIMALTGGPFNVNAGEVTVGVFYNGTTAPGLSRTTTGFAALVNFNIATASSKYATDSTNTGRTTTLPGTLGTLAANTTNYWVGLA